MASSKGIAVNTIGLQNQAFTCNAVGDDVKCTYNPTNSAYKIIIGGREKMSKQNESSQRQKRGNPFKRGKTWSFLYYVTDEKTGKKKPREKGGYPSKKEAQIALNEMTVALTTGKYVEDKRTTVGEYVSNWFHNVHKKTLKPNTVRGYLNNIEKYIIPALGHYKLCELKRNHVQAFYNAMHNEQGLAANTVRYVHRTLSKALHDAFLDELIPRNPCESAKLPQDTPYEPRVLSKDEIRELLKVSKGGSCELEVLLALSLGLRRGEVLGLKFEDFDVKARRVHIRRQITIVRNKKEVEALPPGTKTYDELSPKSLSSNRIISVPRSVMEAVQQKYLYVTWLKKQHGDEYHDNDYVCGKPNGDAQSPHALYSRFKSMLKRNELPDIRFHDLRHSYATAMYNFDVPLSMLKDILGHANQSTTHIYAKLGDDRKEAAAEVFETQFLSVEDSNNPSVSSVG